MPGNERRPGVGTGAATTGAGSGVEDRLPRTADIAGLTLDQSRILHNWIADANGVPAERIAYVAVVEIAEGKYRRRPYLTLAGAENAVERAEARGVAASVVLCELRQVGEVR